MSVILTAILLAALTLTPLLLYLFIGEDYFDLKTATDYYTFNMQDDYSSYKLHERPCNIPRVKFKTFLSWYNINPSAWNITDHKYIAHRVDTSIKNHPCAVIMASFFEAIEYVIWVKQEKKRLNLVLLDDNTYITKDSIEQRRDENLIHTLEIIQSDIDKIKENISKDFEEAEKLVTSVMEET